MKDFTTCKEPQMSGDLIPWNITDWAFTERIQPSEYKDLDLSKIKLNIRIEIWTQICVKITFKTLLIFNKPYDEVLGAAQLIKHVKACKEV